MGVDLVIYVHKDDLGKLLDIEGTVIFWDDFYFLLNGFPMRWQSFMDMYDLEDKPITSEELIKHLAKINKEIENREGIVRICSNYRLLFAPDNVKVEKEWINVFKIEEAIQKLVKENFKRLIEMVKS